MATMGKATAALIRASISKPRAAVAGVFRGRAKYRPKSYVICAVCFRFFRLLETVRRNADEPVAQQFSADL